MTRDIVDEIAQLAYLTKPNANQLMLNIQGDEVGSFKRIEITREQLAGLVIEGARLLWERNA